MKDVVGPARLLTMVVPLLIAVPGVARAQSTFNLKISQSSYYDAAHPDRASFRYRVTREGAPPPGATESAGNKIAVLTAILPLGTTFAASSAPSGVECYSDCAGTVTCKLGPINGLILGNPVDVLIQANRNGATPPLRSASGVVSIEPETFLEDNSDSATAFLESTFSIRAKNANERCGSTGRKIRICETGNSLPIPASASDVLICGIPAAAIQGAGADEVTVTLGARPAGPPLTGDISINGQVVATNAFTYAVRGDANGNGTLTPADSIYLNLAVFLGGNPPPTICSGDANTTGTLTPADTIYLNLFLFLGGPAPTEGGDPVSCLAAKPAGSKSANNVTTTDVLALGTGTAEPGGRVTIPVTISDRPGTPLDGDKGSSISYLSFRVNYSSDVFTGAHVELTGACKGLPLVRDFFGQGESEFAYYAHFDKSQRALPLNVEASGSGNECARITLDVSPSAPKGPALLSLDPAKSVLASFEGRILQDKANGSLQLDNGLVTIQ